MKGWEHPRLGISGGWLTVNEARALESMKDGNGRYLTAEHRPTTARLFGMDRLTNALLGLLAFLVVWVGLGGLNL